MQWSPSVLVVDSDQNTRETIRRGLAALGAQEPTVVGSPDEARRLAQQHAAFDVTMVSLRFGEPAIGAITTLRRAGWPRVLALSATADPGRAVEAITAGATGVVVSRRPGVGTGSIPRRVHDLSEREIEVIRMVADGRPNKWIGEQLDLSALTVKSHLARIGRKLGTGDRAHIVALALRAGVVS